jgi:hypothetical protein
MKSIMFAIMLVLCPATLSIASSLESNFKIVSFDGKWENGYLKVITEIRNTGPVAAGVEIQVIARDANGRMVAAQTFWPRLLSNIAPGTSIGVERSITKDRAATKIGVTIVGARVWP